MKKIILLITLLFPILTMEGCSLFIEFLYLNEKRVYDKKLWKHRDTKKIVSPLMHATCSHKYVDVNLMKNSLPFDFLAEEYNNIVLKKGQCLYDQGYIFIGNIFDQFCHHPDSADQCKLFKQFRR